MLQGGGFLTGNRRVLALALMRVIEDNYRFPWRLARLRWGWGVVWRPYSLLDFGAPARGGRVCSSATILVLVVASSQQVLFVILQE